MVLRLLLANGETKEYDTYYYVHEHWETHCGLKKDKAPQPFEGCDHLDCALAAVVPKDSIATVILGTIFISFCISSYLLRHVPNNYIFYIFIFSIISLPVGIFLASVRHHDMIVKRELIEFRDHGTVNGIKAETRRAY